MSAKSTPALRNASARWQVRRRQLISAGQWEPFVDAEPVRQHLRLINAAGMPYMAVAKQLGLAQESSLQHLMWGRGEYGPGQQVRRETAELVMSYWPSLDDFPDAARIDATGTRRRVQALAVRGWPRHMLAKQAGVRAEYFRKACNRDRITARLARTVAAAYDAWWDQDPLDHGVPFQSVVRVRSDAARCGFHSPLAWDDDTIDDPKAFPQTDAITPVYTEGANVVDRFLMGESVILDAAGRRQAIQHLMEWTELPLEQVAVRMEMTGPAVQRTWERMKSESRKAGQPLRRRVYVSLQDKNMSRNEMESAA